MGLATLEPKSQSQLTGDKLLKSTRAFFAQISDHRAANSSYALVDVIMSGFSIFALKSPSMLVHEDYVNRKSIKNNFETIYGIKKVPSDTQMRAVLDEVETSLLECGLTYILKSARGASLLDNYKFLGDNLLVSIDGTCFFCSNSVRCDRCQERKRGDEIEYSHSMLAAAIVHPRKKQVLPIAAEPIIKQDGRTKNDHELKAAERLLRRIKNDHPDLKITVIADGLFSKGPFIKLVLELGFNYIIGAKPKDHKYLFESLEKKKRFAGVDHITGSKKPLVTSRVVEEDGLTKTYDFTNSVPLNQTHEDLAVGFIEYDEVSCKGTKHFSWVTNHRITDKNILKLVEAARARWKIENETFNTLKNQGYNFEHNYGHGSKNLSNNMAILMMLAFLVDQIQEISCNVFQGILTRVPSRRSMWEAFRNFFSCVPVTSWQTLLLLVLAEYPG